MSPSFKKQPQQIAIVTRKNATNMTIPYTRSQCAELWKILMLIESENIIFSVLYDIYRVIHIGIIRLT